MKLCLSKAQRDLKLPADAHYGSISTLGGLFDALGSGAGFSVASNDDGQGNVIAAVRLPDGRVVQIAINANGDVDVQGGGPTGIGGGFGPGVF